MRYNFNRVIPKKGIYYTYNGRFNNKNIRFIIYPDNLFINDKTYDLLKGNLAKNKYQIFNHTHSISYINISNIKTEKELIKNLSWSEIQKISLNGKKQNQIPLLADVLDILNKNTTKGIS